MASRRPPTDTSRTSATRSPPPAVRSPSAISNIPAAPGTAGSDSPTIASKDGPPASSGATAAEAAASGKKAPAARKPRPTKDKKADAVSTNVVTSEVASNEVLARESVNVEISEDVRRGMIAEAAYLRAERRGFSSSPEQEREDWHAAEAEVDALLRESHGSSKQ
jgi:hypothetical protein